MGFRKVVTECGGTASTWKQDKFIGTQTFGKGGLCNVLAAKWVKDRKLGINFKEDTAEYDPASFGEQHGREEVMQLKINQGNSGGAICEYLKFFGLNRNKTEILDGGIGTVVAKVEDVACYYFVGICKTSGHISGHAFAIDMWQYKFFDPNVGQATFGKVNGLKSCLEKWFGEKYPDLTDKALLEQYL